MTGDGTPPATLTLMLPSGGRQVFTLAKSSVTLGRAMTSDIVLRDPGVSRSHARIERTPTGYDVVDLENIGFVSTGPRAAAEGFRFDTTQRGNGNGGHQYGADLDEADKRALIEYLKTL